MKSIVLLILVMTNGLFVYSQPNSAPLCSDPLHGELCYNMRYLRSQVLAIGAQRELMQVNYNYLNIIGGEISSIIKTLQDSQMISESHRAGLMGVQEKAQQLITEASAQDPQSLATANVIQKRCAACHSQTAPVSGIEWDQIFKNDWENIVKNCSREGRTPYLCKSMNGMLSSYAGILAASQLGRKNFEALRASASEIVRISTDLQVKKLYHSTEPLGNVQERAEEVARLAKEENPEAFEKGVLITQSCMQCHSTMNTAIKTSLLPLKSFLKKEI